MSSCLLNKSAAMREEKTITVIDSYGVPLSGVHLQTDSGQNTITDAKGEAMISVTPDEMVSFSHIGKENLSLMGEDINGSITLEEDIQTLDAVVITPENKNTTSNNDWIWWALGSVGVVLGVKYLKSKSKQPKKVTL